MFKLLYIAIPVVHGPSDPFPLTLQDTLGGPEITVSDMDGFKTQLKSVLSSEMVGAVVGNMIKRSEKVASS